VGCFVCVFPAPAWGCKGLAPLRFASPCPSAFPCLTARTSRGTDARRCSLRLKGKGNAPAPLRSFAAQAARIARRWRGGKLSPPCFCGCEFFCETTRVLKQPHNAKKLSCSVRAEFRRFSSRVDFLRESRFPQSLAFYPFPPICTEATTVATKANKPLRVLRLEDVSVSVFANERMVDGKPVNFYNVTTSKSYRRGDELRRTQSFASDDLNKLCYLLNQADDYIRTLRFMQPAVSED